MYKVNIFHIEDNGGKLNLKRLVDDCIQSVPSYKVDIHKIYVQKKDFYKNKEFLISVLNNKRSVISSEDKVFDLTYFRMQKCLITENIFVITERDFDARRVKKCFKKLGTFKNYFVIVLV